MEAFEKRGAAVWAVSIDPADKVVQMRQDLGLTFPLLSDPDSETIRRYGILNEAHGAIPHPTAVVIDTAGVVRFVRVDEDYRQRPRPEELLAALDEAAGRRLTR